jgi:hypothetical protein
MQIDFHYDAIYVLARYAGFNREEAIIIAHSSQYVDDAENGGIIKFTNYPCYYHIRTAHEILDKDNLDEMANLYSWVPFHFIPGNICDEGRGKEASFVSKLKCRENSHIANEMMEECILKKNDYNGLHRLGLSLHVYADTWAHQNFAGILDKINGAEDIQVVNGETVLKKILLFIKDKILNMDNNLVSRIFPLGHGAVKTCPDLPYLKWRYTNYLGDKTEIINNCDRFIRSAREIFKYMKRYQIGDPKAITDQLPAEAEEKIKNLFKSTQGDMQKRHEIWQMKLEEGYFGFHDKVCPYISYGPNSWKSIALNKDISRDDAGGIYTINESFFNSDWKKFHDAAKEHLDFVVNHLLPKHKVIV